MKTNWTRMKLGDFIKLEYGKPLPKEKRKPDGLYPVYGANGEKDRTDESYYEKKSIIVGRKGSAGEINLTEDKFWPLDVTYYVTFNDKNYNLFFIYYLLGNLDLPKLAKGVKPGINRNEVYGIEVAIPPLPEQQRIVSILDESFAAISKAKENAEKNLQNARELFESYLQSVFANPGDDWKINKLSEVANIVMGQSPPGETYNKDSIGLPLINGPVEFGPEQLSETHTTKYTSKPTKVCEPGDFILCVRGSTTGRTNIASQVSCLGRGVCAIRAKKNVKQELLNIYIASMRRQIYDLGTGSTFPNVSANQLSEILLAIPPIQVQERMKSIKCLVGQDITVSQKENTRPP